MSEQEADADLPATIRRHVERCGSRSAEARAAFREFHDAWYSRVQSWALIKASAPADAEDLVVATFLKSWQWLTGNSTLPTSHLLLRTCLDRAYSDHLRQLYGRAALDRHELPGHGEDARRPLSIDASSGDISALIETLAGVDEVEALVINRETLREHLLALPPETRAAVHCRFVEGRSVAATAVVLSLTPDQVKKRTARGLAILATRLLAGEE